MYPLSVGISAAHGSLRVKLNPATINHLLDNPDD